MAEIKFDHVTFKYPNSEKALINNQSFTLPMNKWISIVGHNGSGKSTLVRLMNGLLQPNSGEITVDGIKVDEEHLTELHSLVGMVFQNPEDQFVGSTVAEDIAFGLENYNVDPQLMPDIINKVIQRVGMSGYEKSLIADLSGGQKQRIAIAGILAVKPKILILDEATSMLDPLGRKTVIDLLRTLHQEKQYTILMITHDLNEAELGDRIVMVDQGRIVTNGSTREVLANEDLIKKLELTPATGQQLKQKLRKNGIAVPDQYMTTGEMVKWLEQKLN